MQLYYARVLNPRKACAVAKYLNSPVDYVHVDLAAGAHQTPAFRAMNPNAKVPVLVDGDLNLWESTAIMCHLARKAGSDLWPRDDRQVEVLRWLSWDAAEFLPHAGALYFEHIIKAHFLGVPPDAAEVEKATEGFHRFAKVLDAHLDGRRYLVGDTLSVADFAVGITLPYADAAKLPLQPYSHIRRWHARLEELDAWREPFPAVEAVAA
ncbi:glutathione S-transferase family protein [Caldimonas brevitalea]|uniref:Glutathione S-transferase n=1 Tax=Caldimonas brevitalea TaxID=413882 RepID=A0A0G3BX09_9BURK|nr:glutathione S-transferase family protein [Caldimonas brevitalea]AKJ31075.1 glutathione S-transferase [Caldimonas brevitalea]